MTELEIVQGVAQRTGLVSGLADKSQQKHRIAEFTRRSAWELRERGWGFLRKTSGENVQGFSVDKIINVFDGRVADLVIDGDGDNPQPAFNIVDTLSPSTFYAQPTPPPDFQQPPAPEPIPVPPPPSAPPRDEDFDRFIRAIETTQAIGREAIETMNAQTAAVRELTERVAKLSTSGLRIHF